MKKATDAESAQRQAEIVEFILDGASRNHIIRYASETWGITSRQAETYLARATEEIKAIAERSEECAFDKIRSRLERLYFKAMGKGDLNLARNLVKDMRDLYGTDKPSKIEHFGDGMTINVTIEPSEDGD